jgi:phage shock protein A
MLTIRIIHTSRQGDLMVELAREILSYLKSIQMSTEILQAKLDELTSAVAAEKAEVSAKLSTLQTSIDDLKTQLANGATAEEVAAAVLKVDSAIADVRGIVEPDAPLEPPVE